MTYTILSPVEQSNAAQFAGLLAALDLPADTRRDDPRIPRIARLRRASSGDHWLLHRTLTVTVDGLKKQVPNEYTARRSLTVADALEATR